MTFQKEADFEEALIKVLADKGWEKEVIHHPTPDFGGVLKPKNYFL